MLLERMHSMWMMLITMSKYKSIWIWIWASVWVWMLLCYYALLLDFHSPNTKIDIFHSNQILIRILSISLSPLKHSNTDSNILCYFHVVCSFLYSSYEVDDADDSDFEVDAAKSVAQIRRDIASIAVRRSGPTSKGLCASYVREAINMAGVPTGRTTSAKDYGPILQRAGFSAVSNLAAGDVRIIQSIPGHPHG